MKANNARILGLWAISTGVHMAAFGSLGFVPRPADFAQPEIAEFEVYDPPTPEPEPEPELIEAEPEAQPEPVIEPEPEPPPKPKPKPKPVVRQPKPKPEPEPPPEDPPPAPEAPVDFTGVTMTAEGASGWSTAVGNGQAITRPVGRIAKVTGRNREGISGGVIGAKGPRLLTPGNLSRRPGTPGNLNSLLVKNYPPRARSQGIEGTATVRVRIMADGSLGLLRIKQQTGKHGFGAACVATLRAGGRWQPALDAQGRPGAYEVDYLCTFEVAF